MKKEMLYDFLSSCKISFALNCWTSSNKYIFLAISDYFISDNWDYHEILLIFKSFHNRHSEENLTNYVIKTLKFHDITNQLLIIMTDNAKNNDKLCRYLQKMLKKKNIVWNHQQEMIYCMIHIIQLVVNKFFFYLKIQISDVENLQVFKK